MWRWVRWDAVAIRAGFFSALALLDLRSCLQKVVRVLVLADLLLVVATMLANYDNEGKEDGVRLGVGEWGGCLSD